MHETPAWSVSSPTPHGALSPCSERMGYQRIRVETADLDGVRLSRVLRGTRLE